MGNRAAKNAIDGENEKEVASLRQQNELSKGEQDETESSLSSSLSSRSGHLLSSREAGAGREKETYRGAQRPDRPAMRGGRSGSESGDTQQCTYAASEDSSIPWIGCELDDESVDDEDDDSKDDDG